MEIEDKEWEPSSEEKKFARKYGYDTEHYWKTRRAEEGGVSANWNVKDIIGLLVEDIREYMGVARTNLSKGLIDEQKREELAEEFPEIFGKIAVERCEATQKFLRDHGKTLRYIAQLAVDENVSIKPDEERFRNVIGLLNNSHIRGTDYWNQTIGYEIRRRVLEKSTLKHAGGIEGLAQGYRSLPMPKKTLDSYGL